MSVVNTFTALIANIMADVAVIRATHEARSTALAADHKKRSYLGQDTYNEDVGECLRQSKALLCEGEHSPEICIDMYKTLRHMALSRTRSWLSFDT